MDNTQVHSKPLMSRTRFAFHLAWSLTLFLAVQRLWIHWNQGAHLALLQGAGSFLMYWAGVIVQVAKQKRRRNDN
jgi:hypothetical protein